MRHSLALLLQALALILAPLALCVGHGAAAAPAPQAIGLAGTHDPSGSPSGHHHDDGNEDGHFCSDCRADQFVKSPAGGAPFAAPAPGQGVRTGILSFAAAPDVAISSFVRGQWPPPPAFPPGYRIRLQI